MDGWLRDARHAARNLRRTPGFALVTILTLALGIGANTAIFSVVNAVILRPLGYPHPEQLIYISSQFPTMASISSGCRHRSLSSSRNGRMPSRRSARLRADRPT